MSPRSSPTARADGAVSRIADKADIWAYYPEDRPNPQTVARLATHTRLQPNIPRRARTDGYRDSTRGQDHRGRKRMPPPRRQESWSWFVVTETERGLGAPCKGETRMEDARGGHGAT